MIRGERWQAQIFVDGAPAGHVRGFGRHTYFLGGAASTTETIREATRDAPEGDALSDRSYWREVRGRLTERVTLGEFEATHEN